jgi:hypothetical protein
MSPGFKRGALDAPPPDQVDRVLRQNTYGDLQMMRICAAACAVYFGLGAVGAPVHAATDDAAAKRSSCATLALAFHKSAAISDKSIAMMAQRDPPMDTTGMVANSKKKTDMANELERRFGKADTASQLAEAEAMSQQKLKPMWDAAEICLK